MKSKKLISLLCAAAMSASAFAGLTVTASAADSVLYSNNFNGFENNKMLVVARPSGDMPSTWIDAANGGNELFKALVNEQTPNEYTFTDADKATVLVKAGETNPDDTAIVYAYAKADDADDTYISLPKSRFSNKTGGMKLDLSSLKAADGEDLVVSFKAMLSAATDGETATFNVGSATGTPSLAATDLEAGTWGDVRLVVTSAGAATLYVNNEQKSTGTVALSEGLTFWVDQYSGGTKKSDGIYARVNIDDLVVMSAAAGTGATVTVPAAKDPEDTTGPVVEQKQAAPSLIAPSSVTPVVNQKFDKAVNINSQTGDDGDTSIDGLKVVLGNVDDSVTGVSTSDYAKGDKVLKMTGGTKSTAGRGPVVSAVDTLPLSDDNSSVMTFAVNLGTTSSTGAGRLYILQSSRQAGSDNLGEYNAVMAALATDDYSYSNGDTSVAINNLDADTWYKVAIVVSSDKYRVWVAKADEDWSTSAQVQNDHVGQGESNLKVTELPMLAVTSSTATKSDGTAASNLTYSTVRIDNMLTYSGTASEPRRLLPTSEAAPTPAPIPAKVTMSVDETANTVTLTSDKDTDAVLVQASYRTDNTLDSVKKVVNVALTAGTAYTVPATDLDAFTTNDKIMVWDSLKTMTPLASAYTIKNGAAQATAKPAPTAEPTEAPAETPATTVAPTAEPTEAPAETVAPTVEPTEAPAETAAPTDTPAPTATAVPTYAVSGTVDAGVKSVTLTDKAEAENTITGTIEDTAVTFTGVKAGTYTVSAVAKDDYKDLTVTPQEITVSGNLAGVFTVTTTAKVKSAVTTAVTGGTATVTGATELKSVAEGTELTVVANTPALGYLAANPTITVTKTDDAETTVTVAEGKFTMPAYPVTVTVAYAADPTVTVATLNHTAHSQWGSNTPAEGTTDNELERFNLDVDTGWAAVAYMDFDISNIDVNTLYSAELTYKATSAKTYPSAMYYLTGDVDLTTGITGAATDRFTDSRKVVNAAIPSVKGGVTLNQDVLAAVVARKADSKANVIFALTGNSGGADLYGKASTDAPTLVAKKGVPVTFTVTAGEDEKVAGAEISVKSGNDVVKTAKTDENGTATIVLLPSTEYTYTVTSSSYAIKKDVAFTTTTESSAVTVELTDNVATTVEIANPEIGTTLAQGEEATYTATVKDQDGRVMTATVDWAVVNSEDVAAENITVANGKVNVAEEATTGDYKVKATVNGTTVSATADLKVIAAEKLKLSITSENADQGTVAYTVNGVTSTDTQLNKGKKIVATATPAALYEFVGWVTSTENLITGTYVSTDAQYSFDLNANTTLIAVFKYTGIYASMNFDSSTVGTKVSGNNMLALGGVGSWSMGGPNSGSNGEIKAASDIAAFTTASGNVYYTSGNNVEGNLKTTAIPVKDNSINFKMDMYFTAAGTGDTSFAIGDNSESQSVLFLKVAANATSGLTADNISDGAAVTTQNIYYYDYATQKWVKTDLKPGVLSIDETVNADGTATVKLNETTINLTSVPVDTIGSVTDFTFNGIRVDGSHKGTMTFYVDNIEVSKVTSTSGN